MVEDRKHAAALQHVDEGILGIEKLVERWQHLVRVGVEVGIRVTVRVGVGLRVGVGVGVRARVWVLSAGSTTQSINLLNRRPMPRSSKPHHLLGLGVRG